MGGKFWQYSMVLAGFVTLGTLACSVLPTALNEDDILGESADATESSVARDGDEEGCWYLIIYYIDTGEIISRSLLGCSHGGGSSNGNLNVTFSCDKDIRRGSTGGCSITTNPSNATLSGTWTFNPDEGRNTTRTGSYSHFEGRAVVSGTMSYSGTVSHSGESEQVGTSVGITVDERTSSSWTRQGGRFSANGPARRGVLESCAATRAGIAADVNTGLACRDFMDEGTPSVGQGTGPWSGLYYIRDHNTSVNVAFQVNMEYRSYRPKSWMNGDLADDCADHTAINTRQNEMSANALSCARPNQYQSALGNLVAHERKHVTLARTEWQRLGLFEAIEGIVDTSASSARNRATSLIAGAHRSITNAANHHTNRSISFRYWRRDNGSLWEYLLVTFLNN